jgi:hypothetical protein
MINAEDHHNLYNIVSYLWGRLARFYIEVVDGRPPSVINSLISNLALRSIFLASHNKN